MRSTCESSETPRRDALLGAALTIVMALVVAGIMIVGDSEVTKTIGLVMLPGVLTIGVVWTNLRDRSAGVKAAVIGGTLTTLFLIGLLSGLAIQ